MFRFIQIPQFGKTARRNWGLDVLAAATKHLTESWEPLRFWKSGNQKEWGISQQGCRSSVVQLRPPLLNAELRFIVDLSGAKTQEWQKNINKQHIIWSSSIRPPKYRSLKCVSLLCHYDMDVGAGVFSSLEGTEKLLQGPDRQALYKSPTRCEQLKNFTNQFKFCSLFWVLIGSTLRYHLLHSGILIYHHLHLTICRGI